MRNFESKDNGFGSSRPSANRFNHAIIGIACLALVHVLMLGVTCVDARSSNIGNGMDGPSPGPSSKPFIHFQSLSSLLLKDQYESSCSLATLATSSHRSDDMNYCGVGQSKITDSEETCHCSHTHTPSPASTNTNPPSHASVHYVTLDSISDTSSSSSSSFLRELESHNIPFVIRGNWSSTHLSRVSDLWTDEYLNYQFGSQLMRSLLLRKEFSYNPPKRTGSSISTTTGAPPDVSTSSGSASASASASAAGAAGHMKQLSNWTTFTLSRNEAIRDIHRGIPTFAYLHASSSESIFLSTDLASVFSAPSSPLVDEWSDPVFRSTRYAQLQCRFSTPGLQSHAHIDSTDNYISMVAGSKEYILLPPYETARLGIAGGGSRPRHSTLDWSDRENVVGSEAFHAAQAVSVTLNAGEILYVPAYWIHHITTRGMKSSIQCNQRNKRSQHGLQELYQSDQLFQQRYQTNQNVKSAKMPSQCANWPDVAALFAIRGSCNGKALCSDDGSCSGISITGLPSTIGPTDVSPTLTITTSGNVVYSPYQAVVDFVCTPSGSGSATTTVFTIIGLSNTATTTFVTPTLPDTYTCTVSTDTTATTDGNFASDGLCPFTPITVTVTGSSASVSGIPTSTLISGDSSTTLTLTTSTITTSTVAVLNLVCSPNSIGTATTTVFIVNGGDTTATATLNTPIKADSYTCQLAVNTAQTTDPNFLSTSPSPTLSPSSTIQVACVAASVTGLPSSSLTTGPQSTLTIKTTQNVATSKVAAFNLVCTSGATSTTTAFSVAASSNTATATWTPPSATGTYSCALSVDTSLTTDSAFLNSQCPPTLSPTAASVTVSCPSFVVSITNPPSTATAGQTASLWINFSPPANSAVAAFNFVCTSGATTDTTAFSLGPNVNSAFPIWTAPSTPGSYSCALSVDTSRTTSPPFLLTQCPPTILPTAASVSVSCPTISASVSGLPSTATAYQTATTLTITTSPQVSAAKVAAFNLVCTSGATSDTTAFSVAASSNTATATWTAPSTAGTYSCALAIDTSSTTDSTFLNAQCPPTLSPTAASVSVSCPTLSVSVSGIPSTATTGQTATVTITTSQQVSATKVAAFTLTCTSGSTTDSTVTAFSVTAGLSSASSTFTAPSTPSTYSCILSVDSSSTTDSSFLSTSCPPTLTPSTGTTVASVAVSCPASPTVTVSGLPSNVYVGQSTSLSITTTPAVATSHNAKFNLDCTLNGGSSTVVSTSFTLAATSSATATLPAPSTAGTYSCGLSVDVSSTDDSTFDSTTCAPTLSPLSASLIVVACASATVTGLPSSITVGTTAPTLTITTSPAASGSAVFNLDCTPVSGGAAVTTTFVVSNGQSSGTATFNPPSTVDSYACVLSVVTSSTTDANFLSTACPPTLSPASATLTVVNAIVFNVPQVLPSTVFVYGTKMAN